MLIFYFLFRIWDYSQNEKSLVFRGERPPGGSAVRKICSLLYVNPHDTPLLASISDDGSLRINSTKNGHLVTAWSASPKQSNGNFHSYLNLITRLHVHGT